MRNTDIAMDDAEPTRSGAFSFAIGNDDEVPEPAAASEQAPEPAPEAPEPPEPESEQETAGSAIAVSGASWAFWLAWVLIGLGLLLVLWALITN